MESMLDAEQLKKLTPEQQKTVIASVQQQAQIQNLQALISKISETCTTSCIKSPGETLSKTEQQCITRCTDRYFEAWQYISRVFQGRIMQTGSQSFEHMNDGSSFS
uniref:Mitochondrial import inner membrane translocase subunit n=1 Tax=Strongyloides venezuelensis TaxID=75913 RepID=A0A0K0FHI3_STRVS